MHVSDRLPLRLRGPFRQVLAVLRASLWVAPAINSVLGILLAVALLAWDPRWSWLHVLDDGEAARATLVTIVAATVTATSLAVTATVVALQLAAGQFSPRLLRDALEDRGLQIVLSVFLGSITYGLTVVPRVTTQDPPRLAVLVGIAGGIVSVGMLIFFLRTITRRLRLEEVIEQIVITTSGVIVDTYPDDVTPTIAAVPDHATVVRARRSGYVQEASLRSLVEIAAERRVHLALVPRVGGFLVDGTPVAHAWPADAVDDLDGPTRELLAEDIDGAIALGVDRTLRRDPAYGIRHLVDIALRAVSPAVNDPTTAVQCIDNITGLLTDLANRVLGDVTLERHGCSATVSRHGFADHIELAQTQLLRYAGDDVWVLDALLRQLRDILHVTEDAAIATVVADRFAILRRHVVERRDLEPHELAIIGHATDAVDDLLGGRSPDEDDDDPPAG